MDSVQRVGLALEWGHAAQALYIGKRKEQRELSDFKDVYYNDGP